MAEKKDKDKENEGEGKGNKKNLKIEVAKDRFEIESGKRKLIQAMVVGWEKTAEKTLLWSAEYGEIDANGLYTPPVVKKGMEDIVTIVCANNTDVKKNVYIDIKPLPKSEEYSEYVSIGEIKPIGQEGLYCINIQAINLYGHGNKCSIVITDYDQRARRILPAKKRINAKKKRRNSERNLDIELWSSFQIRVRSSKKGFASIHLRPFKEKFRKLHVRIKGTTIDREVILKGPKEKTEFRPEAGFMANLTQNFNP